MAIPQVVNTLTAKRDEIEAHIAELRTQKKFQGIGFRVSSQPSASRYVLVLIPRSGRGWTMPNQMTQRDRALDAIEESIQRTLQAKNEYLAAWNVQWKERVAMNFAPLSDDRPEEPIRGSGELDASPALEA